MTQEQISSILAPYIERNLQDFIGNNRFTINCTFKAPKNKIAILTKSVKSHKFTGKSKGTDLANIEVFRIDVIDNTLPTSCRLIQSAVLKWGDAEQNFDLEALQAALESENVELAQERSVHSATASKEEIILRGGVSTSETVDLTLSSELGKYSKADIDFFKWFVQDSSGNRYLRCKDGELVLIPLVDGANAEIKTDPGFWSKFWKSYRSEINAMCSIVRTKLWEAHNDEAAAASANGLRENPVISASGEFSIKQTIHEFVPKAIMARMGARYSYESVEKEGESIKFLKDISPVVRHDIRGSFMIPSEEAWQDALSTAIPNLDSSELERVVSYADNAYGCAIHRIQTAAWKTNLPEKVSDVFMMPPMWKTFFETRLGDQKFASLYRIAKWLVGVCDASNHSRKVLVLSGHGKDGKSLFMRALRNGFNKLGGDGFVCELNSNVVTEKNNTQNGLLECMDARVITSSDVVRVTEFITSETIKNITGGDIVSAQVKYRSAVQKDMSGTKIIVTTNSVTYLSDTFVETRVSPVCFHLVRQPGEADWDDREVCGKLVDEFADFLHWCHQFAYAVECERSIPHHGDQPIWSDGVDPEDVRETWSVIGQFGNDDGMFRYRQSDANSEIEEEDMTSEIQELFYADENSSLTVSVVRKVISAATGMRFQGAGSAMRWKIVVKALQESFNVEKPRHSHGVHKIFGIAVKNNQQSGPGKSRRGASAVSTQLPYGL